MRRARDNVSLLIFLHYQLVLSNRQVINLRMAYIIVHEYLMFSTSVASLLTSGNPPHPAVSNLRDFSSLFPYTLNNVILGSYSYELSYPSRDKINTSFSSCFIL